MRYGRHVTVKMEASSDLVADAILEDKLVDIWPDYPCLYDVRSADFKDRDKRMSAVEDIAVKLGQSDEWVKAKLKALRNSYTKAKKTPSSGSARKTAKRASWLLEKLQFLAPHIAVRASMSSLDASLATTSDNGQESVFNEEPDSPSPQDLSIHELPPASTKQPINNKFEQKSTKRKREEEEFDIIKNLASSIINKNKQTSQEPKMDEIDNFCQFIGKSLRQLETKTRLTVQHTIHNILFQAQIHPDSFPQQMFARPAYPHVATQHSNTSHIHVMDTHEQTQDPYYPYYMNL